jgi:hypothetical protein
LFRNQTVSLGIEKNGGRLFSRPKLTVSCSTEGREEGITTCTHFKRTESSGVASKLHDQRFQVLMVITLLFDRDYTIGSGWKWIYLALIILIYNCLQPFPITHN